jgi:hypothetical protein
VKIIFPKIFEKEVSREMGLYLEIFAGSPFLYKGFISANFIPVGYTVCLWISSSFIYRSRVMRYMEYFALEFL